MQCRVVVARCRISARAAQAINNNIVRLFVVWWVINVCPRGEILWVARASNRRENMSDTQRQTGEDAVRVRRASPDDAEFVESLAPRLVIGIAPWRDPARMLATMYRFLSEDLARMGEESAVLIADDARGVRLGVVTVARQDNFTGEPQAYIGELAVRADAERRGAGRALVRAAEEWAAAHGLGLAVLDTGAANTAARAFYQRLGYMEESVRLA